MTTKHAEKVTVTQPDDKSVVIERSFNAPRELVWKCWTEPKHLAAWFGPHGMTVPVCEQDLRAGGAWRITMRDPQGNDYPLKGIYREVKEPERLVSTVDVSEHPASWHEQLGIEGRPNYDIVWDISFTEKGGTTTVSIKTVFGRTDARDKFAKTGMAGGWAQSLEKLEAEIQRAA